MRIYKHLRKRGLALFMALIMCLSLLPVTAMAEDIGHDHNQNGWQCTWVDPITEPDYQHEHTPDCGYAAPVEEIPCTCGAAAGEVTGEITHAEDCAYTPAVADQPFTHDCGDECVKVVVEGYWNCTAPVTAEPEAPAEVLAFLDAVAALPEAVLVTEETVEAVDAQVADALALYAALGVELQAREDVAAALSTVDAVQAAIQTVRANQAPEVPAEVQAFLDAAAAVLAFGEVTEDNAEEYAALYEIAMAAYMAVEDAGLSENEQVVAMLMKLTGEGEGENDERDNKVMTIDGDPSQTGLIKSAWSRFYAPQDRDKGLVSNTYNCVSGNIAETGYGKVLLLEEGDTAIDSFVPYFYGNHYTGYPYGYNASLTSTIHNTNPGVASANVTWDDGRLNVTIIKGSEPGVTTIQVWYNVSMLHVTSGIACDSDTAYAVSGLLVYTVGNNSTEPLEYWVTVDLNPRACLINGGMPNGERFFRWARQKFAGILTDFKNF